MFLGGRGGGLRENAEISVHVSPRFRTTPKQTNFGRGNVEPDLLTSPLSPSRRNSSSCWHTSKEPVRMLMISDP